MEGYIHSFESFGTSDGPGIRFVVFLQGCPMRCLYCHNPDTREFTDGGKRLGTVYAPRQVLDEILKYEKYIASGGVTVSGGEPMAQAEFVTELFSLLKERGIHTALDTSGCAFDAADEAKTKTIGALLEKTDLILLDIKHIESAAHKVLTGRGNENILAFARFAAARGNKMWIRHVLVPGYTDSDETLKKSAISRGILAPWKKCRFCLIIRWANRNTKNGIAVSVGGRGAADGRTGEKRAENHARGKRKRGKKRRGQR